MSYHAMPFIYLNMGGELIYILEQRLNDQNVSQEKTLKVLSDVVKTLLNQKSLENMFEPQEIYSRNALRQLFERITNSSVMNLSKDSMDRLFDLMIMPIKYQTLLCKEPSELVLVTLNHLNGIKECFSDVTLVLDHINFAHTLFMDNFVETPLWEMASIRSSILNFLLGSRIKITRMLREHRQLDDGQFVLFSEKNTEESNGEIEIELPYGSMAPGTMRYTISGGPLRVETFPVTERFKVVLEHQERAVSRGTVLGQNMFKNNAAVTAKETEKTGMKQCISKDSGNEVQLLSRLLTRSTNSDDNISRNIFNLNLFENELDEKILKGKRSNEQKDIQKATTSTATTKKEMVKSKKSLTTAMKEMKTNESPENRSTSRTRSQGRGEEMLLLMDEAANNSQNNSADTTSITPSVTVTEKDRKKNIVGKKIEEN